MIHGAWVQQDNADCAQIISRPSETALTLWRHIKGYVAGDVSLENLSGCYQELTGKPFVVVPLDRLSGASAERATNHLGYFPERTFKTRRRQLVEHALKVSPDAGRHWRFLDWNSAARCCAPNCHTLYSCSLTSGHEDTSKLSRLTGECFTSQGFVFILPPTSPVVAEWRNITGLGDLLERYPDSGLVHAYTIGHEMTHPQQRFSEVMCAAAGKAGADVMAWIAEFDADLMPLTALRHDEAVLRQKQNSLSGEALAINRSQQAECAETAEVIPLMRALAQTVGRRTPRCWSAVALDDPALLGITAWPDDQRRMSAQEFYPMAIAAAEKSIVSGYELLWRLAAMESGKPMQETSALVQDKVRDWIAHPGPSDQRGSDRWELNRLFGGDIFTDGRTYHWEDMSQPLRVMRALLDVLDQGRISDPVTQRMAELSIKAGRTFMPDAMARLDRKRSQAAGSDGIASGYHAAARSASRQPSTSCVTAPARFAAALSFPPNPA